MTRKVRDNGAEACMHFQKAETIAFFHNSREAFKPETSHAELEKMNECDKTAEEARQMFEELSAQADENFQKNTGRKTNMKAENKLWESVLNLRERHTLEDVQRVNARIAEITGFIPIQTALHRDEGHTDEKTGDFVQNVHAQTTWLTQNPETGKSMAYLLFGRKDIYRQIQDIVAEELGMTRGKPVEITGARHFKNMRDYKQMKRSEAKINKEWEAKLEANNKEWQEKLAQNNAQWEQKKAAWEQKKAEWEAKQAEREEWERKIPEIMAARRKNEQFLNNKVDWETLKTANRAFMAWHDISTDILGYPNPNGNLLIEQSKGALASIFRLFGSVSQLAIFLLTRTEARELKLQNSLNVYKVSENLQRAVNLVANDTTNDHRKIAEKIQSVFNNLPHDKRAELIELAILHAPNSEIREDIKALVEGRFSHIARTEQAQRRIENRDLRAELRIFAEEARKIKEELKALDEENRILNLAERAILREKGAGRAEYAEQEAQNRDRQDEIQKLKDEAKKLKKDLDEARKQQEVDKNTLKEQAAQIKELNEKIAEITEANVKKQKQLEAEKEEARQTAPQMPPKGAFDIIDELEAEKIDKPEPIREEPKIEKPEPVKLEPEPKKADNNLGIYGYKTYTPEPRRHLDDYEPRPREIDRPKYYEPEPIREPEPEKIEQREQKDPWQEIEEAMKKWQKEDSESEKSLMGRGLRLRIDEYEKNGGKMSEERREIMRRYRVFLSYDPIAEAEEAHKNAETMQKIAAMNREREERKQAERETEKKYDDVKQKNVKKEDDTRQNNIKKKRKDELEMGIG